MLDDVVKSAYFCGNLRNEWNTHNYKLNYMRRILIEEELSHSIEYLIY